MHAQVVPIIQERAATTHFNTLQHTATHCNTLQHTATLCNTLQHTATHRNTLQHTATHCNTLQHRWCQSSRNASHDINHQAQANFVSICLLSAAISASTARSSLQGCVCVKECLCAYLWCVGGVGVFYVRVCVRESVCMCVW